MMKLSMMINQLTKILKIYGDFDVYFHDSNGRLDEFITECVCISCDKNLY